MPSDQVGVLSDERPIQWTTSPISRLGIEAMMNDGGSWQWAWRRGWVVRWKLDARRRRSEVNLVFPSVRNTHGLVRRVLGSPCHLDAKPRRQHKAWRPGSSRKGKSN